MVTKTTPAEEVAKQGASLYEERVAAGQDTHNALGYAAGWCAVGSGMTILRCRALIRAELRKRGLWHD